MLSYNDAKTIIEARQSFQVKRIRDFGALWVVSVDAGIPVPPGIPLYGVEKETGIVTILTPFKDIELSNAVADAPVVWSKY